MHFQDKWVTCFPWVEFVINIRNNVHYVCCVICSKVKSKERLLVSKLDNMLKHVGHCKATISGLWVELGFLNFKNNCQHACNEKIYTTSKCCYIFYLIDLKSHMI
jgi:hypothetical protein